MKNLIPEISLHAVITNLLNEAKSDYLQYRENSFLASYFSGLKIDNFDFANEAIAIFAGEDGTNQKLQVYVGFNLQRTDVSPAIHILLPSEQTGDLDTLGVQTSMGGDYSVLGDNATYQDIRANFSRSFSCEYNLMITALSPNQTVLIYHLLRAMLVAVQQNLEAIGLLNIAFSGQDVMLMDEFVPPNVFSRSLRLHFNYAINAPSLEVERFFNKICMNMRSVSS